MKRDCKIFNLSKAETRQIRGDLMEVLKIVKGYDDVTAHTELSKIYERG
jgi:hypothetical protein